MSLENKVALVTGAARGIGSAIAIELARHGITVAGIDIDENCCGEVEMSPFEIL